MTRGVASYTVAEAEHRFRELIARVGAGEKVVIVRRGTPVAAVVPPDESVTARSSRPLGLAAVAGGLFDYPDLDELGKRSDSAAHAAELRRRDERRGAGEYAWNDAGAPGSDRRRVVGRRGDGHRVALHLQKTFSRTNGNPKTQHGRSPC